jgi:hypothetical protein
MASIKCSKCGRIAMIPHREALEGQGGFVTVCPECKAEMVVDLAEGNEEAVSADCPSVTASPLQKKIDESRHGTVLSLFPGEFFGQVTIDRPIIVEGQGKKTWVGALTGPVVKITSEGVVLRNLMIEATGGPEEVAIEAISGVNPILENVIVRGAVIGVPAENVRHPQKYGGSSETTIVFNQPPATDDSSDEDTVRIHSVEKNLSLSPFDPFVEKRISDLFAQASQAEKAHGWQTAIDCYQDIIGLFPRHPDAERLLQRARGKSTVARPLPPPGISAPPQARSPLPAHGQAATARPGLGVGLGAPRKGSSGNRDLAILLSSDLKSGSLDGCLTGCLTWIIIIPVVYVGTLILATILGSLVEALSNEMVKLFAAILGVVGFVAFIIARLLIARRSRTNTP